MRALVPRGAVRLVLVLVPGPVARVAVEARSRAVPVALQLVAAAQAPVVPVRLQLAAAEAARSRAVPVRLQLGAARLERMLRLAAAARAQRRLPPAT